MSTSEAATTGAGGNTGAQPPETASTTPNHPRVPPPLPPPLVHVYRHPIRWTKNKAILLADAVILAHIGVLVVAALYFLITQTNHGVKHWWDTTVTPSSLRHDIRDVGEGVLAACFAQAIVWNPFTRSHQKAGRTFREWKKRYHVPVVVSAIVSATLIGAAAFAIGELIIHTISLHVHQHKVIGSLWNRTVTLWNSNWDKKALGFVSAFVARRPLHVLFDETQTYFASRRAGSGKPVRWYHPPVFQARYNYLLQNQHEVRKYPFLLKPVMSLLLVAGVGLAGYGYYILTYKA
jgi:hypothetical protein